MVAGTQAHGQRHCSQLEHQGRSHTPCACLLCLLEVALPVGLCWGFEMSLTVSKRM